MEELFALVVYVVQCVHLHMYQFIWYSAYTCICISSSGTVRTLAYVLVHVRNCKSSPELYNAFHVRTELFPFPITLVFHSQFSFLPCYSWPKGKKRSASEGWKKTKNFPIRERNCTTRSSQFKKSCCSNSE